MIISSSSSSSDAIIGGVIGGVLGLTFIVYIIYCVSVKICKRQNHGQVMVYPQQSAANTSSSKWLLCLSNIKNFKDE